MCRRCGFLAKKPPARTILLHNLFLQNHFSSLKSIQRKQPMSNAILALGRSQFGNPANKGNLLSIEEAHALLNEWVPNERLRLHMRQVAAVMKAWALEKEGADAHTALKWELAGLLHDADWEIHPESHCRIIIEKLEELNIDPEVIHCIASHGPKYFGVEPENTMDK